MFVAIFSEFHPPNRQTKHVYRFSQTMVYTPGVQPKSSLAITRITIFFSTNYFLITNDFPPICDGYRTSLTILGLRHIFE